MLIESLWQLILVSTIVFASDAYPIYLENSEETLHESAAIIHVEEGSWQNEEA